MAWPAAVLPCFISRFLYRPLVEVGLDLVAAQAQADAAVEAAFGGDGVGGGQAREQQGAEANAYIAHVHNPLMMRVLWTSSGRYAVAHGDIAI